MVSVRAHLAADLSFPFRKGIESRPEAGRVESRRPNWTCRLTAVGVETCSSQFGFLIYLLSNLF